MPKSMLSSSKSARRNWTDATAAFTSKKALKNYLCTGGTVSELACHIMAGPLVANVRTLQKQLEDGLDTYSHTPTGKTVSLEKHSGIGGFIHQSYSCDLLIRSSDLFHRVVDYAGILPPQEWLTQEPLPAHVTAQEVQWLRHYYDRVIEKFEEAVEHDCKWIKELD
ncbi:MAG: hypothetical protein M1830_010331, partial [Pleopsidium flavum]